MKNKITLPPYLYNLVIVAVHAIKTGKEFYFNFPLRCGHKATIKAIILKCGMKIPRKIKKSFKNGTLNKIEFRRLIKHFYFHVAYRRWLMVPRRYAPTFKHFMLTLEYERIKNMRFL